MSHYLYEVHYTPASYREPLTQTDIDFLQELQLCEGEEIIAVVDEKEIDEALEIVAGTPNPTLVEWLREQIEDGHWPLVVE